MSDPLEVLKELAEVDEALHKTAGRLADISAEEERLRARILEVDADFARRKEEHRKLRLAAQERTAEVDATDAKIREYQRRLEHDIVPYKEMEFLREQVQILRAKLDQLSEEALKLMEAVEEDARKLSQDEVSYRERRALLEHELQGLERRRADLKRDQEAQVSQRMEVLARLPAQLRQHYDKLRARFPNPVVYVNGQSCGGCHLRLSETTFLKLQEGREVVTCEHCSRFLVLRWD
ncbi:MAG: C4-type zinc ribbon domain-containing protein [Candidatus Bipolaricaulota bacterium]|nr:C4-type zinc ribbon domain-containing protein [Candidatus Bipolaricaulota bacterium]MDW8126763.1 C4-type zinc ribbon domain-containing protein [Candidatus Bipolaricaulota bacterium]